MNSWQTKSTVVMNCDTFDAALDQYQAYLADGVVRSHRIDGMPRGSLLHRANMPEEWWAYSATLIGLSRQFGGVDLFAGVLEVASSAYDTAPGAEECLCIAEDLVVIHGHFLTSVRAPQ